MKRWYVVRAGGDTLCFPLFAHSMCCTSHRVQKMQATAIQARRLAELGLLDELEHEDDPRTL